MESSHVMSVIAAQSESDLLYCVSAFERGHTVLIDERVHGHCIIDDYISSPSVVRLSVVTGLCLSTAACHNRTNGFTLFHCQNIWQTVRRYFPTNTMKLLPLGVLVGTTSFGTTITLTKILLFSECFFIQFCMLSLKWPFTSIISNCLFSPWASPLRGLTAFLCVFKLLVLLIWTPLPLLQNDTNRKHYIRSNRPTVSLVDACDVKPQPVDSWV